MESGDESPHSKERRMCSESPEKHPGGPTAASQSTPSPAEDTFEEMSDAIPAPPGGLHVRCPNCQGRTPLAEGGSLAEMSCPECGSRFGIPVDQTQDYVPGRGEPVGPEQTLGHFRLVERLGAGGFGAVWKAQDLQLDRAVAVKIPHRGRLGLDETEKFLREARAAAQLHHPNIVGVHDVGIEGQLIYIVSDLVEGLPLDEWLADQRPGYRDSAGLAMKIARALHHAHEHGIVHRDLKPSNIMIDGQGEPHIMDFGLAKRTAGEVTMTADGTILGTPAYMSPEQAKGEGHHADRRTDVYSLGVILFELLTGERPFRGNVQMLIKQVVEDEAPTPRKFDHHIPRDLETICQKCLRKEPAARYPSADKLADELGRFLEGVPIRARPVGAPERFARWCRRNPLVAGSGAAALVGLLFGLIALSVSYVRVSGALEETRQAKNQAEARLLFTKQAVDDLFTEISEDTLLNKPGMQPLRRKLLERAREYYEKFLTESGGDPAIRDELALAHFRVGRITEEVESAGEAIPSYENARQTQAKLLAADPEDVSRLAALGDTLNALGRALHKQGQLDKALKTYDDAVEIRRRLVGLAPETAEFKRLLANSTMNIGLLKRESDPAVALKHLQKAQAIRREALELAPDDWKLRRDLAMGEFNLATVAEQLADAPLAEQSLTRSRELFEALAAEQPDDLTVCYQLAACLRREADLKCEAEKPAEALPLYRRARDVMEPLARENASVPEYQVRLAEICISLGQVEYDQADDDPAQAPSHEARALAAFREARTLLEPLGSLCLEHPRYCRDLIVTLHAVGKLHPDAEGRREVIQALDALRRQLEDLRARSPDAAAVQEHLQLTAAAISELRAIGGNPSGTPDPNN